MSFLFNALPRILFGVQTYDAGSMKAIKKPLLNTSIQSKGVFNEAERVIRATYEGYTVIPIPIHHRNTKKEIRALPRIDLMIEAMCDMVNLKLSLIYKTTPY